MSREKSDFLTKYPTRKVIAILIIGILLSTGVVGMRKLISNHSKTTKIGFEDIGELALSLIHI